MSDFAPIVVFAYRRPAHLESTLKSLRACEGFAGSRVIVFGDGPKTENDRNSVEATRRVAREQLGSQAEYHFREANLGLARSIIDGVTEATRRFGRVIVLEDDLQLSPNFLVYMNSALDRYADNDDVYQVSGQLVDTPELIERDSALFLPFTTSWGWGTWQRAWMRFDASAEGWQQLITDATARNRFNLKGCFDYSTMLQRQMMGLLDSWAIRWYWSVFRNHGVVCFPPASLVRNTGLDGSGTHGRGRLRRFRDQGNFRQMGHIGLPDRVFVEEQNLKWVTTAIWRQNGGYLGAATDLIRRRMFLLTGRHM